MFFLTLIFLFLFITENNTFQLYKSISKFTTTHTSYPIPKCRNKAEYEEGKGKKKQYDTEGNYKCANPTCASTSSFHSGIY